MKPIRPRRSSNIININIIKKLSSEIAKDYLQSLGLATVVGGIMSPVHDAYGKKDLVAAHHRYVSFYKLV